MRDSRHGDNAGEEGDGKASKRNARSYFSAAIRLPVEARLSYLERECKNQVVLKEVLDLLKWDETTPCLLDRGCVEFLAGTSCKASYAPFELAGYSDITFLSEGGQATIYRAVQKSTSQSVVIKVLKESGADVGARKYRHNKEIAILSKLHHPNIVSVVDCGTTADGKDYYVSRYIAGNDLDKYLSLHPLTLEEKLQLCERISRAVDAAHQSGIIHRDLKPSNVRIDQHGEPHVLDFGLAKGTVGQTVEKEKFLTQSGSFLGSIPWASPEQIDPKFGNVGKATDIYQLGVVFYQVFKNGDFPYDVSGSFLEVFNRIINTPPLSLSTNNKPELNKFDDAFQTALAK